MAPIPRRSGGETTHMRYTTLVYALVCGTLLLPPSMLRGEESGCISCHTDDARIRALFVPPNIEFKADEGEG